MLFVNKWTFWSTFWRFGITLNLSGLKQYRLIDWGKWAFHRIFAWKKKSENKTKLFISPSDLINKQKMSLTLSKVNKGPPNAITKIPNQEKFSLFSYQRLLLHIDGEFFSKVSLLWKAFIGKFYIKTTQIPSFDLTS